MGAPGGGARDVPGNAVVRMMGSVMMMLGFLVVWFGMQWNWFGGRYYPGPQALTHL